MDDVLSFSMAVCERIYKFLEVICLENVAVLMLHCIITTVLCTSIYAVFIILLDSRWQKCVNRENHVNEQLQCPKSLHTQGTVFASTV
ncbi:hypothetical protein PHYPO_G00138320 [Pangasianodon hypophthalmus]|uniref:Uncharacterized protein n=1 Tax=Pangasianodon hypophthalmus TaxID=310915 RepID=A0A5N5KDR9_PANHP|nr:hypothetical protein PHYPO_G00138320 [Pangasianodon hypophthalmus]